MDTNPTGDPQGKEDTIERPTVDTPFILLYQVIKGRERERGKEERKKERKIDRDIKGERRKIQREKQNA